MLPFARLAERLASFAERLLRASSGSDVGVDARHSVNALAAAWRLVLIAAGVASALPALGAPRPGGTLNFLVFPEPPSIVGIDNTFGGAQKIGTKVTEGLLKYDFELHPQPQLATDWSISADGLTYTFHLRHGVKWHDGKDFTSDDVAFSIFALKQVHPRGRATFANVEDVETPDPYTAVIVLSKPAPYLITALAASESPIVPKHIYEGGEIASNPNALHPIGTGPFIFKEWVKGSHIILERNPDYWDKPKPYLDRVVVHFIGDAAARSAAFETGAIDLGGDTPVAPTDIERLNTLPFLAAETNGYQYSGSLSAINFNLDRDYFKDRRVREAIAHAIDVNAILGTVWYGYGRISPTPIIPSLTQFHNPNIKPYAFDPKRAEELLDEAGYRRGADGTRFRVRLVYNPYSDGNRRNAEYIKQALQKVGVAATIVSLDFGAYVRVVYTDRDFDLDASGGSNLFDPTLGVQRIYWSKNFKIGLNFSNISHYASAEADRLLEAAAVEPDPDKRKTLFFDFQAVVHDDIPAVNAVEYKNFTIFNKRIRNHTMTADGLSANFADVYIE